MRQHQKRGQRFLHNVKSIFSQESLVPSHRDKRSPLLAHEARHPREKSGFFTVVHSLTRNPQGYRSQGDNTRLPIAAPPNANTTRLKPWPKTTCHELWPGHTKPATKAPAMPPINPKPMPLTRGENGSVPRHT